MKVPPAFVWQPLDGQGWPASQQQETEFVETLRRAGVQPSTPTRPATTALLNALRCGVTVEQLLDMLPNLDLSQVLAAHELLDTELKAATQAWARITANPGRETLNKDGTRAALLLPVPVHRVTAAVHTAPTATRLADAVKAVTDDIERITSKAAAVEHKLATIRAHSTIGIRLGQSLHDVSQPGVWTHPHYLPQRVGALSTTRARDLRGDDRT